MGVHIAVLLQLPPAASAAKRRVGSDCSWMGRASTAGGAEGSTALGRGLEIGRSPCSPGGDGGGRAGGPARR